MAKCDCVRPRVGTHRGERCAKRGRQNDSASVRHFIPSSCPSSKSDGRAGRAANTTVRPGPRRRPSKIISARSTGQPSRFDAAAITIVVTVTIITLGVAVTDTSPSWRGNDLRPWRTVQEGYRTDNGCGAAVGAGTTGNDLKRGVSPKATRRLNESARDERGEADAKRRRTPTAASEAVAW